MGFPCIVPQDALYDRVPFREFRYLGQVAYIQVPPSYHRSFVRLFQPCHNLEKGGLSCAVDPNKAHLFPFVDGKCRVVKQQPFRI